MNYENMEELRDLHSITDLLAIAGIPRPAITNGEPHSLSDMQGKRRIMRSRNT
jgi:hypothetical protein